MFGEVRSRGAFKKGWGTSKKGLVRGVMRVFIERRGIRIEGIGKSSLGGGKSNICYRVHSIEYHHRVGVLGVVWVHSTGY